MSHRKFNSYKILSNIGKKVKSVSFVWFILLFGATLLSRVQYFMKQNVSFNSILTVLNIFSIRLDNASLQTYKCYVDWIQYELRYRAFLSNLAPLETNCLRKPAYLNTLH